MLAYMSGYSLFGLTILLFYILVFAGGFLWEAGKLWRGMRQAANRPSFFAFVGHLLWHGITKYWRRMPSQTVGRLPPSAELAGALTRFDAAPLTEAQAILLRPLVLHWLGLRTDITDSRMAIELPKILRQRWYALDLQHMDAGSAPHAVLAFACLRCAFYLRAAAALGWLDSDLYSQITHLNVLRVRECFADWPSFCQAYDLGCKHWSASGRSDILGEHLNPECLRPWLWPQKSFQEPA